MKSSTIVKAGVDPVNECEPEDLPMFKVKPYDHLDLAYFGEDIVSFRAMLKRPCYYYTYGTPGTPTVNVLNQISYGVPLFPLQPGYTTGAALDKTTANVAYNFVGLGWLNLLAPCFLGWKGAIRWKIMGPDPTAMTQASPNYRVVALAAGTGYDGLNTTTQSLSTYTSHSTTPWSGLTYAAYPSDAMIIGDTASRTGLEFESDPYTHMLFHPYVPTTNADPTTYGVSGHGIGVEKYITEAILISGYDNFYQVMFDKTYVSASDDFNFVYFKYAPVIYSQATRPGPSATL